jgi:hypothetical protein
MKWLKGLSKIFKKKDKERSYNISEPDNQHLYRLFDLYNKGYDYKKFTPAGPQPGRFIGTPTIPAHWLQRKDLVPISSSSFGKHRKVYKRSKKHKINKKHK